MVACRERPAPPRSDAAPPAAVDARPEPLASVAEPAPPAPPPVAVPVEAPVEARVEAGSVTVPALLATAHPRAIMQCKSSAVARDLALGLEHDRALDCPLAIGDRSQRPPWRGSLNASLTKQRRAVAGVSRDDCCYAMAGGAAGHPSR